MSILDYFSSKPNVRKLAEKHNLLELVKAAAYMKDGNVRCDAISALAGFSDTAATEAIITGLKDHDNGVRRAAVRALARSGDMRAIQALVEALDSASREQEVELALALAALEQQRGVELLVTQMGSNPHVLAALSTSDGLRTASAQVLEPLIAEALRLLEAGQYNFVELGTFFLVLAQLSRNESAIFLPLAKDLSKRFGNLPIDVIANGKIPRVGLLDYLSRTCSCDDETLRVAAKATRSWLERRGDLTSAQK